MQEAALWSCRKCGSTERVKDGGCQPCDRARTAAWKAANKDKIAAAGRVYREANREAVLASKRAQWERDKERLNAARRQERAADPEPLRAQQRASYYRNKPKARARARAYYEREKSTILAVQDGWRRRNMDRVKEAGRLWAQRNRDKVRQIKARSRANHPETARGYHHRRRARISSGTRLSAGLVKRLQALQRGKCACCGLPLGRDFHIDHVVPLALGGAHADANIQLLRARCNVQKGAKHPVDFMQSRGFLL